MKRVYKIVFSKPSFHYTFLGELQIHFPYSYLFDLFDPDLRIYTHVDLKKCLIHTTINTGVDSLSQTDYNRIANRVFPFIKAFVKNKFRQHEPEVIESLIIDHEKLLEFLHSPLIKPEDPAGAVIKVIKPGLKD